MNILHVIPSLSTKRGGPSFAVRTMAAGAARLGATVHVIATDDDGTEHLPVPLREPIEEEGVIYRYFRRQSRFYTFSLPLARWLSRHIHEYDVVHIHALFSYASLPAAYFAARHDVPYVVRPLGTLNQWGMNHRRPLLKQLSFPLIERRILDQAALVHYTSEDERLQARQLGVTSPAAVIPLGIDTTPFRALPPASRFLERYPHLRDRSRILFLSRLDPKKGLALLLPAFAEMHRRLTDATLVIAGSGDLVYVQSLQKMARELGVAEQIVWAGHLAGEDKLAAFAAAQLFVLPSYSENFGIAVVEAMAAGLPVVISDQVAIHHEVTAANAGIVTPCAVEPLKEAMGRILRDNASREQLRGSGRELVKEAFSLEAMSHRLLSLYEQAVATHQTY